MLSNFLKHTFSVWLSFSLTHTNLLIYEYIRINRIYFSLSFVSNFLFSTPPTTLYQFLFYSLFPRFFPPPFPSPLNLFISSLPTTSPINNPPPRIHTPFLFPFYTWDRNKTILQRPTFWMAPLEDSSCWDSFVNTWKWNNPHFPHRFFFFSQTLLFDLFSLFNHYHHHAFWIFLHTVFKCVSSVYRNIFSIL